MTIACLDFETANYSPISVCAAGIAVFENGCLTESPHWLVKPPKGHGFFIPEWTEDIHGLSWFDVRDQPEFPTIAPQLLAHLTQADIVIAHNASFDIRVLRAVLDHFNIPCPDFRYLCTLQLARQVWPELPNHQLSTLAAHIGHEFQHHHAQSDAIAAGKVMLAMTTQLHVASLTQLMDALGG